MMNNLDDNFDAILITGPTASGKSALALRLAAEVGGVVINADSMQVYDTLRVVTARPSQEDMQGVAHRLYGHVAAGATYSTGDWLRDVTVLLQDLRAQNRLPVIVGGTGLYFKALTGGLSDMPVIPEALRAALRQREKLEGAESLHSDLTLRDPAVAARLDPRDGQRIIRALEVLEVTGQSISVFQTRSGPMIVDPSRAKKLVVLPDRKLLHDRINRRFAMMMDEGAVEEVEALLAQNISPDMPAMKAIGVSQIAAMLKGEMSRADVIEKASAATRQYAKRQMTWFRNQMDESWERVDPAASRSG
ncbi:tRNA (adenosine(37)-N6)-dimethylallyltransferase MiaA [Agrobacterium vitis]|uniref:tRNA (adenosine(37)-N6)-dimethylallyltransferase MiaA n=1 Tax=Rhizobium/Agrobacterium group TaxID=227290 RepID=UPI0008DC10BC|nr:MULTISPECIES: tRNA (adenosine(37)-N6)-dimethylallyltransferase MiaA [Rhizobium/Agrobacterium group]MCF1433227.1 tRNA (adenosine(37)-N6)-dimethylallyltransferase MiaA [Allorhizobium ampelinum]MUO90918.1 tRNA (adenosine(37)-N6)-dimethylallyltransferase MiaA [Agrobacterium vitis]MUZ54792.1 tRNA (adenosine(37)-N6)-dimethylallyltransferase MiaA [Agrobacterium vitis]MUZ93064.1 tRNA (adenosine(37)-N6)-dimethylallyltransferase MiaA [Agrobacterium vitis]MVA41413.1 tRNA (adenosine(37)-N6)-dimethylall